MDIKEKITFVVAIVTAIIATIAFFINKNFYAAFWVIIALAWIINYYLIKKDFIKLKQDHFKSLVDHEKEIIELTNIIKTLKKKIK